MSLPSQEQAHLLEKFNETRMKSSVSDAYADVLNEPNLILMNKTYIKNMYLINMPNS
jgi:hypothetical protein